MLKKCNSYSRKYSRIKKNYLRSHTDQTQEIFHFNCYVFIFLIQFSMLSNVNRTPGTLSQIKNLNYVATVVQLMNYSDNSV